MKECNSSMWPLIVTFSLWLCSCPSFGIGEPPGIQQMIDKSDLICCGIITGIEITDKDEIGSSNRCGTVIFEFTVDHLIKGNASTNKIRVFCKRMALSEDDEKEINRANSEVVPSLDKHRLMWFLVIERRDPLTFRRLPRLNAELPLAPVSPNKSGGDNDGIEASIEIELAEAIGTANDATKRHLQSLLDTWKADRQRALSTSTNSQEVIREP